MPALEIRHLIASTDLDLRRVADATGLPFPYVVGYQCGYTDDMDPALLLPEDLTADDLAQFGRGRDDGRRAFAEGFARA